jgi:hypothetical protein
LTTRLVKPVSCEVDWEGAVPFIVTITLHGVQYRLKGTRTSFLLPHLLSRVFAGEALAVGYAIRRWFL